MNLTKTFSHSFGAISQSGHREKLWCRKTNTTRNMIRGTRVQDSWTEGGMCEASNKISFLTSRGRGCD